MTLHQFMTFATFEFCNKFTMQIMLTKIPHPKHHYDDKATLQHNMQYKKIIPPIVWQAYANTPSLSGLTTIQNLLPTKIVFSIHSIVLIITYLFKFFVIAIVTLRHLAQQSKPQPNCIPKLSKLFWQLLPNSILF